VSNGRPARGPRPAGAQTRAQILAAAARLFTADGYEPTSIRAVARDAAVDPALVRHYFDSKVGLFVESMRPHSDPAMHIEKLSAGEPALVGERVMRFYLNVWADPEAGPRHIALLRAAIEHPAVARHLRQVTVEGVLEGVARRMGASDPKVAASAAASQVVGLAMLRYVARLEPLASMPPEHVIDRFAPVVTHHLRS